MDNKELEGEVERVLTDQALVNEAPAGLRPSGFDPSRKCEFVFEAPSGSRVLSSRFIGINCGWAERDVPYEDVLWWSDDLGQWVTTDHKGPCSSSAPCRSYKAFKRHIRRHAATLAGRNVRLVSRFIGHDVIAFVRDRDRSGEADETRNAAQPEARARAEGIAQTEPDHAR